ncbi:transposable element Tcb2 transposase [Trichonephila clavipes]|uniref:Transposable element Tcb2 transposase n=1 Tax=Trichonephila clavipes TaxID=2585209 RepID=A0A8X7BLG3_TRICX|nr:transposable element Tcb2 transposase [Trichonephila clavipes]
MPDKRARRHFLQLSEFKRSLIIGMKTAGLSTAVLLARWIVRSVPLETVGGSGHEKVPTCGKPVTRSTIRADVGVAIAPQAISRHLAEANFKSKRTFHALPLTPKHRQLHLQWCQARPMWNVTDWQKVVFSDESRFVWGTDDNPVRVWRRPDSSMAVPLPNLSPVEHVWDELKRQMPSCHSVHDLELAVQDLCTHLPQDNIRCLINSTPYRVAACITTRVKQDISSSWRQAPVHEWYDGNRPGVTLLGTSSRRDETTFAGGFAVDILELNDTWRGVKLDLLIENRNLKEDLTPGGGGERKRVLYSKKPMQASQRKEMEEICQVIYSQFGLAIHQNDHQARRRFVEWAQNEIAVVPDFHKRFLFSDEAHFWLNGYVNKQNCRICSEANPKVYVETPSHPEKLTV